MWIQNSSDIFTILCSSTIDDTYKFRLMLEKYGFERIIDLVIENYDVFSLMLSKPIMKDTYILSFIIDKQVYVLLTQGKKYQQLIGETPEFVESFYDEYTISLSKRQWEILKLFLKRIEKSNDPRYLQYLLPYEISIVNNTPIFWRFIFLIKEFRTLFKKGVKSINTYYNMITDKYYFKIRIKDNSKWFTINVLDNELKKFLDLPIENIMIHENDPNIVVIDDYMVNYKVKKYAPNYSVLYPNDKIIDDYGRIRIMGVDKSRIVYENNIWIKKENTILSKLTDKKLLLKYKQLSSIE